MIERIDLRNDRFWDWLNSFDDAKRILIFLGIFGVPASLLCSLLTLLTKTPPDSLSHKLLLATLCVDMLWVPLVIISGLLYSRPGQYSDCSADDDTYEEDGDEEEIEG